MSYLLDSGNYSSYTNDPNDELYRMAVDVNNKKNTITQSSTRTPFFSTQGEFSNCAEINESNSDTNNYEKTMMKHVRNITNMDYASGDNSGDGDNIVYEKQMNYTDYYRKPRRKEMIANVITNTKKKHEFTRTHISECNKCRTLFNKLSSKKHKRGKNEFKSIVSVILLGVVIILLLDFMTGSRNM